MARTCQSCGTNNPDNSKFCTSCGSTIGNGSKQSNQAQPHNIQGQKPNSCLWCKQSNGFDEEEGKLDSKWGVTAHKVKLFICRGCGYVHLFGLGRSIWDFD